MSTSTANGNLIGGEWVPGSGDEFTSTSPSDSSVIWQGATATASDVGAAINSGRKAFEDWWTCPVEKRVEFAVAYAEHIKQRKDELAELISRENGKPLWEAKTEAGAVVGKSALAVDAFRQRRDTTTFEMDGVNAVTRYKPFGVLGVLGPFNFPAHLPNGHIVPALIAGNTIVFKPSEQTPAVGQWLVEQWKEIGLPPGVVNLVQGGRETGVAIAGSENLDGLLFTGSSNVGSALHKAYSKWPQKILALEMGGNNALIACNFANAKAAAYTVLQSAFLTAGQRCTCARRLILVNHDKNSDAMLDELKKLIENLTVGYWDDSDEPFMGPVIDHASGRNVIEAQQKLIDAGGKSLIESRSLRENPALLSPGIVDVTAIENRGDHEVFGPLLSVIRVEDFDSAIDEANNTAYGLSAGLISDDSQQYETFIKRIRAGVVNWNRQTTGASGKLPFGGCGLSGNHRPGGYFAADYCSWPVASLESSTLEMPESTMPGVKL